MNTLLREFENMLDTEAKKIVNEMINMYYKKVIVNKNIFANSKVISTKRIGILYCCY